MKIWIGNEELAELLLSMDSEEALERLKGTAPAGPHQRLVGEHAERAENQTPTNFAHSSAAGETEDGVERQRCIDYLKRESARLYAVAGKRNGPGQMLPAMGTALDADGLDQAAAILSAGLPAKPQTKSDSEEVQPCPSCGGTGRKYVMGKSEPVKCWDCHGTAKRMSGACLPNTKDQSSQSD